MGVRDVHVDAVLSNVVIAYTIGGFIADLLAPKVPVWKESDKYYVFENDDTSRVENDLIADGASANEVKFRESTESYFCEEYGLKTLITQRQKNNADSVLKLESRRSKALKDKVLVGREKRVATIARNLANYATGLKLTLSGTSQWSDGGYTGDPLKEIQTYANAVKKACGSLPNIIVMPYDVAIEFINNAKVIERYKYTKADLIEEIGIPKRIQGLKVIIPGINENTSNEGTAANLNEIWGNDMILAKVNYGGAKEALSKFYTFTKGDWKVKKWKSNDPEGTYVKDSIIEDTKTVSTIAGYLIKDVI